MTVRVLFFASLADLTGSGSEEIEVPDTFSVADLWAALGERHAALRGMRYRPLVACDREYATYESPLAGVSEVAFLPAVSGG